MEHSIFKKTAAILLAFWILGPLGAQAMSNCRAANIKVPTAWEPVRGFVAPDDAAVLEKGYWRRYQITSGTTAPTCYGGYIALVEKIYDLATKPKLVDITAAATGRAIFAKQFMAPGAGKQMQPNRVLATQHKDGTAAIFVGRIADDAPDAPSSWMLFCRLAASDPVTYFQTHLGHVRPSDLPSLSKIICQTPK